VPQYDFTKTPDQNAVKGNTAGYSYTKNQAPVVEKPVAQIQPMQPQQDVSQFQNIIDSLKTQQANLTSQYETDKTQRDQAYNDILEAKRMAVRSAIQKAQGTFQRQIQNAPQQFQDQRNNVAVNQSQNLQNIRKSLANLGYNPDSYVTRGEMQNINVGAQGQINQLDIAQKQLIQDAQNSITELEAQGNIDDASAVAEIANQKIQALDNLRNQYINQSNVYNRDVTDNVYRLMDYNRNISNDATDKLYKNLEYNRNINNDEVDKLYKQGTLQNTAQGDYYDFLDKQSKNDLASKKAQWEALGYMMPAWAEQEIPDNVMNMLAPYQNNFSKASEDFQRAGQPELAKWAQIASVQKMFNNPALLQQYGQQYATKDMQNNLFDQFDKNRKYGLEVGKFDYGIAKDDRDFNYGVGRDAVEDNKWQNEFGLKEWSAKDASARGWDNNAISRQAQKDLSARGWANIGIEQGKVSDKQLTDAEKDIDSYIQSYFTSDEMTGGGLDSAPTKTGRKTMSDKDKNNVKRYLEDLDVAKVPYPIIKSLKAKYNIKD
jgi:hypothetical protein